MPKLHLSRCNLKSIAFITERLTSCTDAEACAGRDCVLWAQTSPCAEGKQAAEATAQCGGDDGDCSMCVCADHPEDSGHGRDALWARKPGNALIQVLTYGAKNISSTAFHVVLVADAYSSRRRALLAWPWESVQARPEA